MKSITMIFRIVLVSACCLFFSVSALTNAGEVETPADAADPVIKVEYGVAMKAIAPIAASQPETTKTAVAAKSKKSAPAVKKGLIYLPVISLSSYLPMAAQVILMILVISLSGLFGAWLMFRFLAKKVMTFEEIASQAPAAVNLQTVSPVVSPSVEVPAVQNKEEGLPLLIARARTGANLKRRIVLATDVESVEIKKLSRKEKKKKGQKKHKSAPGFAESGGLIRVGDRLVLKRPGESHAASVIRNKTSSAGLQKSRMPQKFLINDWFPMDQQ